MTTIRHLSVRQAQQQQASDATFNNPLLHLDPQTRQMRPNPEFVAVVTQKKSAGTGNQ